MNSDEATGMATERYECKNGDKGQWGTMGALGRTWGMYIDNGNAMKQAVRIVGAPRNAGKRFCFWATVGVGKDVGDGRGTSKDIWEQCCALKEIIGSH
ncbi:unnamed protein product [Sphagnum balticum]